MASLPEHMHSFAEDAKKSSKNPNEAPNCISGGELDKNFRACLPVEDSGTNAPYKVKSDSDGWKLEPTLLFDVCENGQPRKYLFFAKKIGSLGEAEE